MEQRVYGGNLSAVGLAEALVRHFDPIPDVQAQKFEGGDGWLVQVGTGDDPKVVRHAVTVAITPLADGQSGVRVTMGQQQWLMPDEAGMALVWAIIAAMVTPWVLFLMLLPLREAILSTGLPRQVWEQIEAYARQEGGALQGSETLAHPHS